MPTHEVRPTLGAKRSLSHAKEHEDSSDNEMRLPTPVPPPNIKDKGKGKVCPDSDTDVEVISIKSSSSIASECIQEMLDAIPAHSDVDDVGDSKKERNEGAAGKKLHMLKGQAESGKTTAKSEIWFYNKWGNFHSGKQKLNTEANMAEPTSAKPNPKSRAKEKEKDSHSHSCSLILSSVATFFYWLVFCFIYTECNFHSNFTFLELTCS